MKKTIIMSLLACLSVGAFAETYMMRQKIDGVSDSASSGGNSGVSANSSAASQSSPGHTGSVSSTPVVSSSSSSSSSSSFVAPSRVNFSHSMEIYHGSSNYTVVNGSVLRFFYTYPRNVVVESVGLTDTSVGAEYSQITFSNNSCSASGGSYQCAIDISAYESEVCVSQLPASISDCGAGLIVTLQGYYLE